MPLTATFTPALEVTVKKGALSAATSITSTEVLRMFDLPQQKVIQVELAILPGHNIVLWSGDDYDAAGQWTDADILARIASAPVRARIQSIVAST